MWLRARYLVWPEVFHMLVHALFAAAAIAAPNPTNAGDTWRLEHVFANVDLFEAEVSAVRGEIDTLAACEGTLTKSALVLADCMERAYALRLRLARLYVYASNHSNVDTRDDAWQARTAVVSDLYARIDQTTSWFDPELQAGADTVRPWLSSEPRLAPFRYPLETTLRRGEHTLTPEGERLLALTGEVGDAPQRTFTTLTVAEIPWPVLTIDGEKVTLIPAAYAKYRSHPDRAVRRQVMDAYFTVYRDYQGTFGNLLDTTVRTHWITARARGYDSSLEAALASDFLPPEIYDTLITEARAGLPTLHRYFKLRAKMTDIPDLGYHDLYMPLVPPGGTYPLDRSKQLALKSAKPLGKPYVKALGEALDGGWIDAYPREGKRGGAYMSGAAWDVHPFVLLNHNDDWEGASTLAHEMGHAMHSVYANRAQPYPTASYATFTAEIASTFNEALLLEYVLTEAKTDDERLFYLGNALENLRGTFFRQTMFAEFERDMHRKNEAGEPLTGTALTAMYAEILRDYHGSEQGVVQIHDAETHEWAFIPHFYYDFYVWQYATSLAASSLLAQRVIDGEKGAVERYLALLEAGGSDDPHVLLKTAGVDMTSPEPYRAVVRRMDAIMDEIEAILAKREK